MEAKHHPEERIIPRAMMPIEIINFGAKMTYYLKEGLKEMGNKTKKISEKEQAVTKAYDAYIEATIDFLSEKNKNQEINSYEEFVLGGLSEGDVELKYVKEYTSGVKIS